MIRPAIVLVLATLCLAACSSSASPTPGGSAAASGSPEPSTDQPLGAPVTDDTRLCDLLGPGDFDLAGIEGAGLPDFGTDGPGSAYCVYAGESAGTGGIELDIFVDRDPGGVYATILEEGGGAQLARVEVAGADRAEGWDGVAGVPEQYGRLVARSGRLIFALGAPGGPGTLDRLVDLAETVIERGAALRG